MPTLEIAYGEAGWKPTSSSMGSLSADTRPKTSDDAQTWMTGFIAASARMTSSSRTVPRMFVFSVSIGASKLVFG